MLGMRKTREQARKRVLTAGEIKKVWTSLDMGNDAVKIHVTARLVLKMILLTGQRPGEVSGMRWDEIDGNLWTIPAERIKAREDHQVPLNPMALDVLDQTRFYLSGSDFIFQSDKKPGAAITRAGITDAVKRNWKKMGGVEAFTPHDLRRTVRTMLASLKVDDIVAEKVMGHKLQGMLAVYNQYPYDAEKRQALSRWEVKLSAIIGQDAGQLDNVILFTKRGA